MKIDVAKAKESWMTAGLNAQGQAVIFGWIDQLAANIEAGHGKWNAYARYAIYDGNDKYGSIQLLKEAVEETSK